MEKNYGVIAIDTTINQVDTIGLFETYYESVQCMLKTAGSEQEVTLESEQIEDNQLSFNDGELLYQIIDFNN